jgi:hypothetical protein
LLVELASQEDVSHNLIRNTYWDQCASVRPILAFDPSHIIFLTILENNLDVRAFLKKELASRAKINVRAGTERK